MIPKGLPGEGDLLVFDNGGQGGYGTPNPGSVDGTNNARRDYSRVLQFNPVTLEITWQYTPHEAGWLLFTDPSNFLQLIYQLGAETSKRKYTYHGRFGRTPYRGHTGA